MGKRIYSLESMMEIAIKHSGICLSKKYISSHSKLLWQCKVGHKFSMPANSIINKKYWCPECGIKSRFKHSIESLREQAKKKDWVITSDNYEGGNIKLDFICSFGHNFKLTPEHFLKGIGCRACSGKALLDISVFKKIAMEKGGICLSDKYVSGRSKLKFKCSQGHDFDAAPGDIRNSGSWCKKCVGLEKGTIEEMKSLAKSKGGQCLSKVYVDSTTNLEWKCIDGHIWSARPRDVKHKSWCPECNFHRQEGKCRYILERLLSVKFSKTRKLLDSKLELDGYSKEYNLAFEYNGEQHYLESRIFKGGRSELAEVVKRDQKKIIECKQKNIDIIVIPYTASKTDKSLIDYIKKELSKIEIQFKNIGYEDFFANFFMDKSILKEANLYVEKKHGKLLGNNFINNQLKLKVSCKLEHEWEVSYPSLKAGRWCPYCAGTIKGTIAEAKKLAAIRGGFCLSEEYRNNKTKMVWRCSKGHEWLATSSSVGRGTWCIKCGGKEKLTIALMNEIASKNRGTCLSDKYINKDAKLKWQCAEGHTWMATPGSIKNSKSWCPSCYSPKRGAGKRKI